jgi:hypothetical protein
VEEWKLPPRFLHDDMKKGRRRLDDEAVKAYWRNCHRERYQIGRKEWYTEGSI